jgi:sulfur carrier protein
VAVAVAGEVIPRGRWTTTSLGDGDQIEVVAAIQGG